MNQAKTLLFRDVPGIIGQYARAVIPKRSTTDDLRFPSHEALLTHVKVDHKKVAEYARLCGFHAPSTVLPITYLHILAFPLHMELMLHKDFPLALMGLVHIRNHITQYRGIYASEELAIRCYCSAHRQTDKGLEFDITSEVTSGGELIWKSISTNLSRQGSGRNTSRHQPSEQQDYPVHSSWRMKENLGRQYARISGDSNPIHLYAPTAKLFGFKRHIAHGMWTKARAAAALNPQLIAGPCSLEVEFKQPIFLPGNVSLHTETPYGGAFYIADSQGQKRHLKGYIQPLE